MGLQKPLALVLGIVLALVGILGFFMNPVLGVFSVNMVHSIIHLLAGLIGIYAFFSGVKHYNWIVGIVGIVLGVLGFVPVVKDLLTSLLMANMSTTLFHLIGGIVVVLLCMIFKEGSASPAM